MLPTGSKLPLVLVLCLCIFTSSLHDSQDKVRELLMRNYQGYGVADAWAGFIWNRFPKELLPLHLTPFIEEGRIQEAQEKSVVNLLPGEDVESYSGFFTVNTRFQSHMFFWFFPAVVNAANAPVLLWLNGGPSRPSVFGAILENGPIGLHENMTLYIRNTSWTRYFSMLYVDNPVGSGYSYSVFQREGYSKSMKDVSENLYSVLIQFFKLFPEYAKNDFYVGGQSYAGKYVPSLGVYIHQRNHDLAHTPEFQINFKGIYLGAGFCDPRTMIPKFADLLYILGIVSGSQRRNQEKEIAQLIDTTLAQPDPDQFLGVYFKFFTVGPDSLDWLESGNHILGDEATVGSLLDVFPKWMNSAQVRLALHAGFIQGDNTLSINMEVIKALQRDLLLNVTQEMAFLMDNYKVLYYSGSFDVVVSVAMSEAFLESIPWSGQAAYNDSVRTAWLQKSKLIGFHTKVQNFTRVIVWKSGHFVPSDQPEVALQMMRNFIYDKPFTSNLVKPSFEPNYTTIREEKGIKVEWLGETWLTTPGGV